MREVLDETHQVYVLLLTVIEGLTDEVRIERVEPAFYLVWMDDQHGAFCAKLRISYHASPRFFTAAKSAAVQNDKSVFH